MQSLSLFFNTIMNIAFIKKITLKTLFLMLIVIANIETSFALTLSTIAVQSKLNEPLKASIRLLNTQKGDIISMKVKLSSDRAMLDSGIKPSTSLRKLKLKLTTDKNKQPIILVYSEQPIKKNVLTFLLDVKWSSGQLLKQYSILLSSGSKTTTTDSVTDSKIKKEINRKEIEQKKDIVIKKSDSFEMVDQFGPTIRGNTLWDITDEIQKGKSDTNQMMMAIYKYNKEAFVGRNINRLKKGVILRIPDNKTAYKSLSKKQALRLVRKHNKLYRDYVNRIKGITSSAQTDSIEAEQQQENNNNNNEQTEIKTDTNPSTDNKNMTSDETENITKPEDKKELELLKPEDASADSANKTGEDNDKKTPEIISQQIALEQGILDSKQEEEQEIQKDIKNLEQVEEKNEKLLDLKEQELANLQNQKDSDDINVNEEIESEISSISENPSLENILYSKFVWISTGATILIILVIVVLIKNNKEHNQRAHKQANNFDGFVDDVPDMPRLDGSDPSHSTTDDNDLMDTHEQDDKEIVEMLKDMKDEKSNANDKSFVDIYEDKNTDDDLIDVFDKPVSPVSDGNDSTVMKNDYYDRDSANNNRQNEVDTMLELAKTYIDIQDHENAKQTLEEVLDEGNEAQKQQARKLISSIV
ncbi:MAG: hypothetical protein DRQ51_04485 [Gammaproteobacteria bacterium]|nr:MAG: hypothetical protein DRQ51_04485 [Gammaproteobacteria bacterium]